MSNTAPEIKTIPRIQLPKTAPTSPAIPVIQSKREEAVTAAPRTRSATNSLEEKLLSYLSRGCSNEDAAAACGISTSRVSQIITEPEFAERLQSARFAHAVQYQERDLSWDSAEDKLLEKLHEAIPVMHKPAEILSALRIVNGATRRAVTSPDQIAATKSTVSLIIPTVALSRFVANAQNQVVQAGTQSLITIQSGVLSNMAASLVEGEAHERLLTQEVGSR